MPRACAADGHRCLPFVLAPQGIIHRDIKPENMLLTADGDMKLSDFGLAINAREERPVTRAGTLDYMSPEVLKCPDKRLPEENKNSALVDGYGEKARVAHLPRPPGRPS